MRSQPEHTNLAQSGRRLPGRFIDTLPGGPAGKTDVIGARVNCASKRLGRLDDLGKKART